MSDSRRAKRIASLIQSEISRALVEDVADPTLHHVIVNGVDLSPDLKNAKVFYAVGSSDAEPMTPTKEIEKGIKRAIPYFRKRLGENLGLKFVPQLQFENDHHSERVARLFSLLDEVKRGEEHP